MSWIGFSLFLLLSLWFSPNLVNSIDSQQQFHPICDSSFTRTGIKPVAFSVTDVTCIFQHLDLPEGACVFNPAMVRVAGNVFCLFARVYDAKEPTRRCRPGHLDRPPFLDGWRGRSTNLLALVRLRKRNGTRSLHASLLGHSYLAESNLEDGRLFKDQNGRIFIYLALPLGIPPKRAVINTVSRVLIRCTPPPARRCSVSLGYPRLLSYLSSNGVMDKNWVPWNGSALMSYSHYGTFGPHSVFDWGSYDEPTFHTDFDAVAEDPLFPAFASRYGMLMHLSGGSPAVLESGGKSYLAVGHLKAHPGCFHPEALPAWTKGVGGAASAGGGPRRDAPGGADGRRGEGGAAAAGNGGSSGGAGQPGGGGGGAGGVRWDRCAHLAESATPQQKLEVLKLAFMFGDPSAVSMHYPWDYAFFFYRFNASPPYNMTHMSHGFLPFTGGAPRDHSGIVFPIGLDRLGPEDYLVSYGDSDQASRLLLLPQAQVDAMLWPVGQLAGRLDEYSVCSLPCGGPTGRCLEEGGTEAGGSGPEERPAGVKGGGGADWMRAACAGRRVPRTYQKLSGGGSGERRGDGWRFS